MALSQLNDELRSTLYFGKFKYKAVVKIPYVWITRLAEYYDADAWDQVWKDRNTWNSFKNHASAKEKTRCYKFAQWRMKNLSNLDKTAVRIVTSSDKFTMHTNDLKLFSKLSAFNVTTWQVKLVEANEKCVKFFKGVPKFKHRTYFDFRNSYSKIEQVEEFCSYLRSLKETHVHTNKIAFCPSLHKFLISKEGTIYLYGRQYFIDYDDSGFSVILRLIGPQFIHKDYILRQLPEPTEQLSLFETEKTA